MREIYYIYELIPKISKDLSPIVQDMIKKDCAYYNKDFYKNDSIRWFNKKKYNQATRIFYRIQSISRATSWGELVYSSIVSPRKGEEMDRRIKEYFRRAEIAVEADSLTYPYKPQRGGRNSSFNCPNFRCHWCGGLVSHLDTRYCSEECRSNYYGNFHWETVRCRILARDKYTCQICKKIKHPSELNCDHIKAICNGGDPFNDNNLQTLCIECHKIKTKRDLGKRARRMDKIREVDERILKLNSFMERLQKC